MNIAQVQTPPAGDSAISAVPTLLASDFPLLSGAAAFNAQKAGRYAKLRIVGSFCAGLILALATWLGFGTLLARHAARRAQLERRPARDPAANIPQQPARAAAAAPPDSLAGAAEPKPLRREQAVTRRAMGPKPPRLPATRASAALLPGAARRRSPQSMRVDVHCPGSVLCRRSAAEVTVRLCLNHHGADFGFRSLSLHLQGRQYSMAGGATAPLRVALGPFIRCVQAGIARLYGPDAARWPDTLLVAPLL